MRDDQLLLNPGPVPVSHTVTKAMDEPMVSRRSAAFGELYQGISADFRDLIADSAPGTGGSLAATTPVFMNGTATMAIEAVLSGLVSRDDTVLVVENGQFGQRIEAIANRYASVEAVRGDPGSAVDRDAIERTADRVDPGLIAVVHNETSTGLANHIGPIGDVAADVGALLVVDGVSSIGGMEFRFEEWNVDAAITDPQKALAAPPGISAILLSDRARRAADGAGGPFYQNLETHLEAAAEGRTPFTCAGPLFRGFAAALSAIHDEGMADRIERHRRFAASVRAGITAMGLEPFPATGGLGSYSDTMTAVALPAAVDEARFDAELDRRGVSVGGGLGPLEGDLFRVSNMGALPPERLRGGLFDIGSALDAAGGDVDVCAGVQAFERRVRNDTAD